MESVEPTPPKVRRMTKHAAMHVSECVREFKLPVHYPGLALGHKPVSKEHTLTPSMTVLKTTETEPQTIDVGKKISKGKNVQLVECIDKKVVHQISSDKVLSGTNRSISSPSSNIKTLKNLPVVPMSNSLAVNYNNVAKLKTLKLKSPDGKDLGEFQVELLDFKNQVQKRKLITIPTSALTSKDESDNLVTSTQNEPIVSYSMKDVQYPGLIYQEPRIEKLENDLSSKVKIVSNVSLNKLPADDLSKIIQGKQMIKTIFSNTPFEPPTISTKTDENSKKLLYLKTDEHPYLKSITKTGKPIALKPVKLKSLTLNLKPSEINDPIFTSGLSGYKNGDMDEDCEDESENGGEIEKIDSPTNEKEGETQNSKREWKKLEYTLTKKNVMVMLPKVPPNKKLMTNRRQSSESSLTTSEEDFISPESPKQSKSRNTRGKNSDKKRKENHEDAEFNQSVDISIVERALASVKDKTLRDEALKILASCKLGIERQIPIRPPSNEISVRDTVTQTDIFGNLDRECEEFIEVKKSEKGVKRINKIMRDSIAFKSLNSNVNPVKNYEAENDFSSQLDKMIMELDIDSNEKQEMTKIKNVLERPMQSVEKMNRVQKQIIDDIKSMEICDENGFTGLHKAIVRDDIKAVKRLLMIMPMTKNNIDAKSYDNRVSLLNFNISI